MYDKLTTFLNTHIEKSKEEEERIITELWEAKAEFAWFCLIEYTTYLEALFDRSPKEYYKERLENLQNEVDLFEKERKEEERSKISLPKKETRPYRQEEIKQKEERYLPIYKAFLTSDYLPPTDPYEMFYHLEALWFYYFALVRIMPEIPFTNSLYMDFAMTKIANKSMLLIRAIDKKGSDRDRTFVSTETKQRRMQERRKRILRIVQERINSNPRWLEEPGWARKARFVKDELGEEIYPSIKTVVDDLKQIRIREIYTEGSKKYVTFFLK